MRGSGVRLEMLVVSKERVVQGVSEGSHSKRNHITPYWRPGRW